MTKQFKDDVKKLIDLAIIVNSNDFKELCDRVEAVLTDS